jgi:hypothetical protein
MADNRAVPYKSKAGRMLFKPTQALVLEMDDDNQGFCLACGEVQDDCEPDAARYTCECCGENKVYGAAELALMGLVA